MGKYDELGRHLAALSVSRWDATFEEIEAILGFKLPESARNYNPWWANQSGSGHSQSRAWQSVGWRTENVRPQEGRVSFVRDRQPLPRYQFLQKEKRDDNPKPGQGLTIAEAKAGLAIHFGVPAEQIDILIKG